MVSEALVSSTNCKAVLSKVKTDSLSDQQQSVTNAKPIPVLTSRYESRHDRRTHTDAPVSHTASPVVNGDGPSHNDVICDTDDDDFSDYVRKPPIRYYVGGFKPSITVNKLYKYITKRGLTVTTVRNI